MSSKKTKVLFLSSWFPTKKNPTKGNFVEKHLQAVAGFCDVAVLHVSADNTLQNKIEISLNKQGEIPYLIIYFKPSEINIPLLSGIIKLIKYIRLYFKGYKIIIKGFGTPDIIHGNIIFPVGIIAYLIKKIKKLPYVFTEHWTAYTPEDPTRISRFQLLLSKIIARNSSLILPVSDHLGRSMKELGIIDDYEVVPNVVDTEVFKPSLEIVTPALKTILHVSTLIDEQKNFSGILRVLSRLKKLRSDFILDVITDGNSEEYYSMVTELELNGFVKFSGIKTTVEIAEIMKHSSFLLLFSNYENLPCVIVEAFAAGLPVISTDVGGIKEHLNDNNGVLIQKGDEVALFEAIDKMLDNTEKYNKTELAQYASENFSYTAVGQKYKEAYNKILKQKH
jgi:glycosyltransferase involved in cell wall biosynthesis